MEFKLCNNKATIKQRADGLLTMTGFSEIGCETLKNNSCLLEVGTQYSSGHNFISARRDQLEMYNNIC